MRWGEQGNSPLCPPGGDVGPEQLGCCWGGGSPPGQQPSVGEGAVFTVWGGGTGQGRKRELQALCESFA